MSTIYDLLEKWADETGAHKPELLKHHLEKLELEDKLVPKLYSKDLDSDGKVREIFDLTSISVRNVKAVAAREVEIKPGITMLYGPNDSGKSTFLEGIELALKGARGEVVPALMRCGTSEMEVKLRAAAVAIDRMYTKKTATRGKKTGEVTYEHTLVAEIDGVKDNKTEKAQGLIQSWADVDLDFIIRCSLVRQGHLADVLDEEASKRQALFFRLLALDAAEETRANIAAVARKQAAAAGAQESVVEPAQMKIAELKVKLSKMPPVDQMKTKLHELESTLSSGASRVDKEARLSLMRNAMKANEKFKLLIEKYTEKINEMNKSPALFLQVEETSIKFAQAEFAMRNNVTRVAKAEALADLCKEHGSAIKRDGICPTCAHICGAATKETLTGKGTGTLVARYKERMAEVVAAQTAKSEADALFTHLCSERVRGAATAAEKVSVQQQVAMMNVLRSELEILIGIFDTKSAAQDIAQLEQLATADAADPKTIEAIDFWRKSIADAETMRVQVAALEQTVAAARAPVANGYDPAVLEALELAFSKKGMPLWIARGHVGRVNAIAAELAEGDRYKYELTEDLAVRIIDGENPIAPRAASGSSKQRGALVILVALSLYLQELAQIRIPVLWIDEIPFQDKFNQAFLVDLLKAIGKRVPKLVFGASDWEDYLGKFDHEIGLTPPKRTTLTGIAVGLLEEAEKHPTVSMFRPEPPLSKVADVAKDAVDKMVAAAPKVETFDDLEDRLNPLSSPTKVDPMMAEIPVTTSLAEDVLDDDPF